MHFYDVRFKTAGPNPEVKTTILTVPSATEAQLEFTRRYPYLTFVSAVLIHQDLDFYPERDTNAQS